jgi:hypothetical protein
MHVEEDGGGQILGIDTVGISLFDQNAACGLLVDVNVEIDPEFIDLLAR